MHAVDAAAVSASFSLIIAAAAADFRFRLSPPIAAILLLRRFRFRLFRHYYFICRIFACHCRHAFAFRFDVSMPRFAATLFRDYFAMLIYLRAAAAAYAMRRHDATTTPFRRCAAFIMPLFAAADDFRRFTLSLSSPCHYFA